MVNRKKDMDKPQHIKHEDKLRCLGRVGVPAALMTSVVFYPQKLDIYHFSGQKKEGKQNKLRNKLIK